MYIILSGEAAASISGESGEVMVREYVAGDYFGEIALLFSSPRKATVRAVGYCRCLYVSRIVFESTLGSIKDILKEDVALYTKYADAIKMATEAEVNDDSDDLGDGPSS